MTTLLTPTQAEAIERQEDHGRQQANAQAASIAAMVAALTCDYDRLQELRDERKNLAETLADQEMPELIQEARAALKAWDYDNAEELNTLEHEAGDCADQEEARQRIQEDPLSVEVRSAWDIVGGDTSPAEFRIVLCTGGPHVEIRGELDQYQQPSRAWIQYQDWGTPLTQYFDIEAQTLLTYCQEFYFGE
jgi:hypothetical protein